MFSKFSLDFNRLDTLSAGFGSDIAEPRGLFGFLAFPYPISVAQLEYKPVRSPRSASSAEISPCTLYTSQRPHYMSPHPGGAHDFSIPICHFISSQFSAGAGVALLRGFPYWGDVHGVSVE